MKIQAHSAFGSSAAGPWATVHHPRAIGEYLPHMNAHQITAMCGKVEYVRRLDSVFTARRRELCELCWPKGVLSHTFFNIPPK